MVFEAQHSIIVQQQSCHTWYRCCEKIWRHPCFSIFIKLHCGNTGIATTVITTAKDAMLEMSSHRVHTISVYWWLLRPFKGCPFPQGNISSNSTFNCSEGPLYRDRPRWLPSTSVRCRMWTFVSVKPCMYLMYLSRCVDIFLTRWCHLLAMIVATERGQLKPYLFLTLTNYTNQTTCTALSQHKIENET